MKVLFLNSYDDPAISGGGAEVTLHHLTQGLLKRGVEPVMLSITEEAGLHQSERDGVRIWRAGLRNLYWLPAKVEPHRIQRLFWRVIDSYNLAMQPALRKVLEVERPDVVSFHNLQGWSAAAWATVAGMDIPSVQVLHDFYLMCRGVNMYNTTRGNCTKQCMACRLLRLPHRSASKQVSAVVGVSRFILDRYLEQGYFRNVPIRRAIHNARDKQTLGVGAASTRQTNGTLRIGYIGALTPSKGIELLLQAFADADIAGAELHVAGTGDASYAQGLHQKWAGEHVHFLGRVAPHEFYPKMDFVVVPSLWQEPLGMVVAEALTFGKPVIGARRGGIPEMIRDGENGLLFDPDHPGELRAALERLAADAALRARMTEAARTDAFTDMESWVSQYLDIYKSVIAKS